MGTRPFNFVLRHLCREVDASDGPADGQLLGRFVRQGDEDAFTVLLQRHGPMVLGVCRRIAGGEQDAEDAFQATFLVLLRKAADLNRGDSLGGWLLTVARRIALKAREAAERRCRHERQAARPEATPNELEAGELRQMV